jgi:hypothetical protein
MAAEVITTEKILKLINNYDFLKIRLLRGSDAVYLDQVKPGETAADLSSRFQDWIFDFIQDDNFKEYKLELYGNQESDPAAKKTLFLKTTIQFNPTPGQLVRSSAPVVGSVSKDEGFTAKEYIELAREKAILEAKCETLENKYLDLEDEIQELREQVETGADPQQPKTMGEVMNAALMQNADKIIGVLVDKLMGSGNNFALAGLEPVATTETKYQIFDAMCEIEPSFPDHLSMLYQLRKNDPMIYNIALAKLKNL